MAGQGKKTSAERRRELAAQRRAAAAAAARKRRMRMLAGLVAVVLVGGAVVGAIFGVQALLDDDETTVAAEASPTPTPAPTALPAPAGKVNCTYTPGETASREVALPPSVANATGIYEATIQVNNKPVVMEMDAAKAPCAVNSFVHLAKANFFDDTPCHRELNSPGTYVLQCGDPTGTGTGGPGYTFAEENLESATYEKGVVAMAKAAAPATSGSQFFMMFDDSDFPPQYTPFGTITSGLEVLTEIAKAGTKVSEETGAGDVPAKKVTINKVTITKEPKSATAKPKTNTAKPKASASPTATSTP